MPRRAIPVILTVFLAGFAAKTAAADEISPAKLLDKYGFSAVKPAVLSACHRIEKTDLPELSEAYRCWTEADHAFCSQDRKSTRLNSSHIQKSRMPSSA